MAYPAKYSELNALELSDAETQPGSSGLRFRIRASRMDRMSE